MSDHAELREAARQSIDGCNEKLKALLADYDRLRQQCDELVKALRFYADTCSYMWSLSDKRTKDTRKVLLDSGYLARTAIAKYRENT